MAGELVDRTVEIFYDDGGGEDWHDISADALNRDPVQISRGIANEGGQADPGELGLTLNNGVSNVEPSVSSRYARGNALSDLFGLLPPNTPIRVSAGLAGGAQTVRMHGEVVQLPPRADVSQRDLWVPVQAAGVLRRLGIPDSPLRPAVERYLTVGDGAANLVGFWPMTGTEPRSRPAVAGEPMMPTSVLWTFGTGDLGAPWLPPGTKLPGHALQTSDPVAAATVQSDAKLTATLDATYRFERKLEESSLQSWSLRSLTDDDDQPVLMVLQSSNLGVDPEFRWEFFIFVGFGGADVDEELTLPGLADGATHHIRMETVLSPGSNELGWAVYFDGAEILSGTLGSVTVNFLSPSRPTLSTSGEASDSAVFGPIAIWAGDPPDVADSLDAFLGHPGEHAGRRVERLCGEQGVDFTSTGDLDESAPLGPQYPDNFLTVLDAAATVEAGGSRAPILVEQATAAGLHFNTLASLYLPRAPDLTLDYEAAHIGPPFDPTPDDFGLVNDATARRRDGGEAQTEVFAGPKGISAAGRYDAARTFGALSDSHLGDIAGHWSLHGTWDEDRFPVIRIDMRSLSTRTDGAALVAAAQALDPGALIRIENPPAWLPQQDIEQIVLGVTETISTERWLIDLHTTAAAPFTVPEVEHAVVGIAQSDSATLDEALDTTETGVDIDCGAGPDWVHEADFDIVIRPANAPSLSGERMTVTAVGAMSGTFPSRKVTLTVTRSVNGIVTTHASGSLVEFATKAHIGLWG